MFTAFLIVVALLFLSLVTRTYVRRWWHNRGSIDPHATERSRLLRAGNDVEPFAGRTSARRRDPQAAGVSAEQSQSLAAPAGAGPVGSRVRMAG